MWNQVKQMGNKWKHPNKLEAKWADNQDDKNSSSRAEKGGNRSNKNVKPKLPIPEKKNATYKEALLQEPGNNDQSGETEPNVQDAAMDPSTEDLLRLLQFQESILGKDDPDCARTKAKLEEAHRRRQDRDRIRKEAQAPEKQLKHLSDRMGKCQKKIARAEAVVKEKEAALEASKQEVINAETALNHTKNNVEKLHQEVAQLQQDHAAVVLKLKSQKGEQPTAQAILQCVGLQAPEQLPPGSQDIMNKVLDMLKEVAQLVQTEGDHHPEQQVQPESVEGRDVTMEGKDNDDTKDKTPERLSPPHKTPRRDVASTPAAARASCS